MNDTTAIMQPYLFPYLGYFNLVRASGHFVFYDDVNFIKKGWIHRNRIMVNGQEHLFTVPLKKPSQNVLINQIMINDYNKFSTEFMKKIELAYKRAPFFTQGMRYLDSVFCCETAGISALAIRSIVEFCQLLKIDTQFYQSSISFPESIEAGRVQRLIQISQQLGARNYINAAGGKTLYRKEEFAGSGLTLQFLIPQLTGYSHINCDTFTPGLSVIDILMNVPLTDITKMLNSYRLE